MKNTATPTKSETEIASPFKNQKEIDHYKKEVAHLATTIKNYQAKTKFASIMNAIAFKDSIIVREIIAWHMNLKRQLFDISQ